MTLRMTSLLPDDVVSFLDSRFGDRFRQLPETHRLALATAAVEGQVTHSRLSSITTEHPHDLTLALRSLVDGGFLISTGATRATRYFLPGSKPVSDEEILEAPKPSSEDLRKSSEDLVENSEVWRQARELSEPIRSTGKAPSHKVRATILKLSSLGFFTLKELAALLGRTEETIRQSYLSELVRDGELIQKYPSKTHPKQAYKASKARDPTE